MRRSEVFCTRLYASLQLHFDLHRLTVFPACIFSNYRGFDVSFRFSWIRLSFARPLVSILSLFLSPLHHSSYPSMPRCARQRRSHQSDSNASQGNGPPTSVAPPSIGGNRVQPKSVRAVKTLGPDDQPNWWKCTSSDCEHTKKSKQVS